MSNKDNLNNNSHSNNNNNNNLGSQANYDQQYQNNNQQNNNNIENNVNYGQQYQNINQQYSYNINNQQNQNYNSASNGQQAAYNINIKILVIIDLNNHTITNTTIHIIMEIYKILIIIIKDTIKALIVKIIHTVLIKKKRNDQNSFQ